MPELEITIGGRTFQVACQAGEEHFLRAAAQMLDNEAQPLMAQLGRLPDVRMLLMAGLMLADKAAAVEDELRALRAHLAETSGARMAEPQRVEVEVIPPELLNSLAEIAARAEALAETVEDLARA